MPTITVGEVSRAFPEGTEAQTIFEELFPGREPRPLAASLQGRARPLNWAPETDCALGILDYTDEEGRRVYERSLRFLFLSKKCYLTRHTVSHSFSEFEN